MSTTEKTMVDVAIKYSEQLIVMAAVIKTVPEEDRTDVVGAFFGYLTSDPKILGKAGEDSLYGKFCKDNTYDTEALLTKDTDARFIV